MENYNPFGKPIQKINGTDLHILRNVYEGWYIDYKQQSISISDYAKHISSFANQYGGWLIIGIKELKIKDSKKKGGVAGEFCGITQSDVQNVILQIRESISRYVNPDVYYETKIINGPNKKIGLEKDKSIIVIGIPQGVNPPYVHKTGKIYRRLADQSDPKAETDRFILDELWKRGEKQKQKLINFINNVPKLSEAESKNPYIYFNLLANPLFENRIYELEYSDFEETMKNIDNKFVSLTMDRVFVNQGGYFAKQVFDNSPMNELLSFRWWHNGNAQAIIPINSYSQDSYINQLLHFNDFKKELLNQKIASHNVCDFSKVIIAMFALFMKYIKLYKLLKIEKNLNIIIKIVNIWRAIPFINSSSYIEKVKKYGIPIVREELITIPFDLSTYDFIKIDLSKYINIKSAISEQNYFKYLMTFASILANILTALNIIIDPADSEGEKNFIIDLISDNIFRESSAINN